MAGKEGIEPSTTVLETVVIPLNYFPEETRDILCNLLYNVNKTPLVILD